MGLFGIGDAAVASKTGECCANASDMKKQDGAGFAGVVAEAMPDDAKGGDKANVKQQAESGYGSEVEARPILSELQDRKVAHQERQDIRDGLQELDAKLFEMEQSGEMSQEDLKGVKEQYDALKERAAALPESPPMETWREAGLVGTFLGSDNAPLDKTFEQMDARIERLENVADGQDVPDRVPEGAIRVDHRYTGGDDSLMDTSMVSLGKDADGFEQFAAFSPTEQTNPGVFYRDEAGNFTTNRNEAVMEFDGVASDPSILPDNAILDDNGNYWMPTGADEDGTQTFQPLRSGDDLAARPAVYTPFYQDAEGNFSTQKGDDAVTAEDFEAGQWEPQLPEGAVAVNADGDGDVDYHMVSIGADENGQERYIAVQQDYSSTRPDQQIYTRNEDGSFETLDGEPMEALEQPEMRSMLFDRPVAFEAADGEY